MIFLIASGFKHLDKHLESFGNKTSEGLSQGFVYVSDQFNNFKKAELTRFEIDCVIFGIFLLIFFILSLFIGEIHEYCSFD